MRHWSRRLRLRPPPWWMFPSYRQPIRLGSSAVPVTRSETLRVFPPCRFPAVLRPGTYRSACKSSAAHLMKRVSCGSLTRTNRRTRGTNGIRSCDEVLVIFSANGRTAPRTSRAYTSTITSGRRLHFVIGKEELLLPRLQNDDSSSTWGAPHSAFDLAANSARKNSRGCDRRAHDGCGSDRYSRCHRQRP